MATTEFNQNLRNLRDKMPSGYIADLTGGSAAKKMILHRIFTKNSAEELTKSEADMLEDFLNYAKKVQAKNESLEKKVNAIAGKIC